MRTGILLATYNGIKYIEEQLDSIINQTVAVDEIIVSDDCSTDGTFEFLKKYIEEHPDFNFVLTKNKGEHGPTKNFEHAYKFSTADILFFCDQDDVWKKDKVELFVNAALKYPECGMIFSDAELVDANLKLFNKTVWDIYFPDVKQFESEYIKFDKDYIVNRLQRENCITGMCMAVKREYITFPEQSVVLHDDLLAINCAMKSNILCVKKSTAYYRQHEGNVVGLSGSLNPKGVRRNTIKNLVCNSYVNLKNIAYEYLRSKFFFNLDTAREFDFLSKIYTVYKKRYDYAKKNRFLGSCKLFVIFLTNLKYKMYTGKTFILDVAMMLFVKKKERIKYFENKGV